VLSVTRFVRSHPGLADTDGDGLSDWHEYEEQSDPTRSHSFEGHYSDASRLRHRQAVDAKTGIECPAIEFGQAEGIVIESFKEKFAPSNVTFIYEIHFFQPDATGETITLDVASVDDADAIDTTNSFGGLTLTEHPGDALTEKKTSIPGASGQVTFSTPSKQGWYMLQLLYHIQTGNRAIRFRVKDSSGNPVPTYWIDGPVVTKIDVTFDLEVQPDPGAGGPGRYAFYKGGAYRSAKAGEFAYIRDLRVDGKLLYERAFDQGKFSFPLGYLAPGSHTLTAVFESSGGFPTKLWEHVCVHSFDPSDLKKAWDPVQILYMGEAHTRDYDAWSEGVAFRQGAVPGPGIRPPPVRRGTRMMVALEHASLSAGDGDVRIADGSSTELPWSKTKLVDYTGGYFDKASGFSSRPREHWVADVPANTPVGTYHLRGFDAAGAQIGNDVAFYVIHDPYPLLGPKLSKAELETYGYDEDEDGKQWDGYGPDSDQERDEHGAYHWDTAGGFKQ
jgi:hypothetical protein